MNKTKKLIHLALLCTLVFALVCALHFGGFFSWIEHKSYDSRMKVTAPYFSPSEKINIVLLDQKSLDWAKKEMGWGWPWPRAAYASMIDFFNRGNAASVAFDMIYSEPSLYGPEDDDAFASACQRFGRAIQTVYYDANFSAEKPVLPVEPLAASAALLANVTSSLDADGTARRSRFYADTAAREPGLALANLVVAKKLPDISAIPHAKEGGMYVRYQRDLGRYIPYNAAQILQSEYAIERSEKDGSPLGKSILDPRQFKGSYVFFGLYAPGLYDICTSPVAVTYPGVGVHISQLDTILQGNFLRDTTEPLALCIIFFTLLAGCLLGAVFSQSQMHSMTIQALLFVAGIFLYIFAAYLAFYYGLILPFGAPLAAFILSFAATVSLTYATEGKQKRYIKAAFSQYLSPTVINNLIDNPSLLKLGGERREITAYFSDIQGFTSISEGLSPEQLSAFLNTYLSAMTDVILSYGGTIDKYEGDAIIAFWNAPTFQKDHARRGLEAAMECQRKLAEMQEELMAITGKPVKQRIGLNTGSATVGNFGSSKRFDYTMMGDTVNLASRLEGINKQFGTYTMCSQSTMDAAQADGSNLAFRNIANIAVVGRTEPVLVYTPMSEAEYKENETTFAAFENPYGLFRQGDFATAKDLFHDLADRDPVSAKYAEKCRYFIENPPENWQGYLKATEK